ncbi:MAG: methyltransferase [Planctomycetes bacterium GWF2_41_51]|nr:MAG: methyltransferase [Planctomycetes bacterium GWF2_41_51]HBG26968.1 methyltransferase [Phycisphaerales bacterium]
MTSRQRVINALNHKPVDRIPVDLGGTVVSGAHVSVISKLRQALGLDLPGYPVKVVEPAQMLGEVAPDLQQKLGIDVVYMYGPKNIFGFANENWKPWRTFDDTNVLVPGLFNTTPSSDGSLLMYPEGDQSVPPSAKMPENGFYFDAIIRQKPLDDSTLSFRDNIEEFILISDDDLAFYENRVNELYNNSDMAIAAGFPGTAFGDVFLVPAPFLKDPKGIRDIEEWYISTVSRKNLIKEIFCYQTEMALANFKKIYQAVGNKVQIIFMDGTDFAAQDRLFCSTDTYRELYQPYHKKLNHWIHANTQWKTMKHCCGACDPLIEEFIAAGFDILNPIQCSAIGMEPQDLANKYGGRIVFWGGGVDTQKVLPFGTPDQVYDQVRERLKTFGKYPGFIFNTIHNIQCGTPLENIIAMFKALEHWPPK